jgi:hypothetical protein
MEQRRTEEKPENIISHRATGLTEKNHFQFLNSVALCLRESQSFLTRGLFWNRKVPKKSRKPLPHPELPEFTEK